MSLNPQEITDRLKTLLSRIPEGVRLVAVSKFHPVEAIEAAYGAGQRLFGESRVQELLKKIPLLPADIQWHFIGHLQTNKVKALIGHTSMIESVDSVRLLNLIEEESGKAGVITNVLLQVHVALEEAKFGFSKSELLEFFASGLHSKLKNIKICGLMAMATNTDDASRVEGEFAEAASIFHEIKRMAPEMESFETLSMGMTDDWPLAVKEGSNMIRVGSGIFGYRQY